MSFASPRLLLALITSGLLCEIPVAASDPADELKAAIVLSFLRYSDWPSAPAGNTPLTVGVLGEPSLVQTMRRILDGKVVENRPVKVVELRIGWDPRCCQAVYLASAKTTELQQALTIASGARVLTVGENKRFLELGGAVNLLTVDGRMTFEVSLEALERSAITISSKLLRFGQIRGPGKGGA